MSGSRMAAGAGRVETAWLNRTFEQRSRRLCPAPEPVQDRAAGEGGDRTGALGAGR